ncbi:MAG: DMT family transporter [Clostridia bacterium]|nr:DMT family transporter [Clostridia bacterium]
MKQTASAARLSVVLSMVIFGTIGIFRTYIPTVPSGLLASLRGIVGALFLLAFLYLRGKRLDLAAIRKNLLRLIVSGVLMGFNWILLFEAYRFTSVATATLCYYMAPVFVILASPLLLKERLTARRLGCVLVALVGMIPVSGVMSASFGGISELNGVALGLGAAVLYACVVLINQTVKDIGAYDKTIVQLGAAGLSVLIYSLLVEDVSAMPLDAPTLALVGVVCIFHTGICYALYFGAMGRIPAQTVALLSYIDPVVSVLLSATLLRQGLDVWGWVGAVLILGAAVLGELPARARKEG